MYTLEVDVLNEEKNGELDLLLLQDDEFRKFKEKQFLYPDIADKVLNFKDNINVLELDVNSEHGYPLDGFGVAFGRTQFVLMFDEDELETYPIDTTELLDFAKENPDTFTYPNPMTDETGGEFIRTVIYELIGQEKVETLFLGEITETELEIMIKPALDYLKRLDAYILKDEGIYFKSIESVDQAFKDGLLYYSMSQDFAYAVDAINNETYPDGARSFIFENGTIMDTMYFAVPMNASNKTGAIVAINEMLSIQLQLDKYTPSNWGNLPIVDLNLMNESDAASFGKASVKRNTVRVEELAFARYNELPMSVIEMINKLWDTHVNQ
jgi:putative spermidine/putrescine transport system substrate-binding protein